MGAFVRLRSRTPVHFSGSSGCGCLLPWDAEILHHTLRFDVALARGGRSPLAMRRMKPGGEMPSPGRVRTDSTALVLPPLPPLHFSLPVSNYCSSAQINTCTSKPLEQMNSGPRANLSQWSFATDFKWDWDSALQPSPVFPLFTHSCAAHVEFAGSSPGFGMRHSQV